LDRNRECEPSAIDAKERTAIRHGVTYCWENKTEKVNEETDPEGIVWPFHQFGSSPKRAGKHPSRPVRKRGIQAMSRKISILEQRKNNECDNQE
jgi:hypothetical protein